MIFQKYERKCMKRINPISQRQEYLMFFMHLNKSSWEINGRIVKSVTHPLYLHLVFPYILQNNI